MGTPSLTAPRAVQAQGQVPDTWECGAGGRVGCLGLPGQFPEAKLSEGQGLYPLLTTHYAQ